MKTNYIVRIGFQLFLLFFIQATGKSQVTFHQIDLAWEPTNSDCFSELVCFTAFLKSPDQDIGLNRITIKLIFDQSLFSNAEISSNDQNYSALEISENAAPASSGIAAFDFGGAPVFFEADLNNLGTKTTLTDDPKAFFTICMDTQPNVLQQGVDECLTLLWDQDSNNLNAPGFDGQSAGIEVSIGGANDEADEMVDHYGWDYGLGDGIFGGMDSIEACRNYCCIVPMQFDPYLTFESLYNLTNGPSWTNNSGWLSGCDFCEWYGVTCVNGSVLIDLRNNNLVGTLPSTLSGIDELSALDLRDNQLSGTIPLGMRFVNTIRLDNNMFSGSIPDYLGDNVVLNVLTARNNQLSGCFSSSLQNICQISELSFDGNVDLPNDGDIDLFCSNLNGVCIAEDCDGISQVITTSPVARGTLRMFEFIQVSGRVQHPNRIVRFEAGDHIEMLPGFEVKIPALYTATIKNCIIDK